MKKLLDAEFEIMKVVWANELLITTNIIMEQFGKECTYHPIITKEEYLKFESSD